MLLCHLLHRFGQTSRASVTRQNATRIQEFLDLLMPQKLLVTIADPAWQRPLDAKGNFTVLDDGHSIFRSDPFYGVSLIDI